MNPENPPPPPANDEADPFASLGTLSAQLLGVVAVLTQEVVRAKAVDVERLHRSLDGFWEQELNQAGLSKGERRMVESVKKVMSAAFVQEPDDGHGG